jgi:pimeloyl-[acyl-carrier protein] methyl ester esterase
MEPASNREQNSGRTRLVLLPGMDGTGLLFKPLLDVLPRRLEPIVVSYPANRPLGYEDLLEVVLNAIPTDQPFLLLGESFSGPLALMAASTCPPGLQGVVLCASFVRCPLPWFARRLETIVGSTAFALAPSFIRTSALLGRHATPELRALLERAHRLVAPEVMAARARAIHQIDASSALRSCPVPLLYVQAENDRIVSPRSWNLIAERRSDARIEVLPGPHLVLQTHPMEAVAAIECFMEQHEAPAV